MTFRAAIMNIVQQDDVNFLLSNRIPRQKLTRLMGWFSRIEHPFVRDVSLQVWRLFSDLDLSEAEKRHFRSIHDCFTRRLKSGARPINMNPDLLVSPCDAIVGASGKLMGNQVLQVKGSPYSLDDLLGDAVDAATFKNGRYVTLRLTSSMYHRFHAPHDCHVSSVTHICGDTWNVNPIALKRIDRLFCKNERAVIRTTLSNGGHQLMIVPVAAILVGGIQLGFLDMPVDRNVGGRRSFPSDADFNKGDEMGWFEHGSTIIVFAPKNFEVYEDLSEGAVIRVGQPLMRMP